jgi:hypothetical protein
MHRLARFGGGIAALLPSLFLATVAAVAGNAAANEQPSYRRGDVSRNPETGGLENILLAVDPALDAGQCRLLIPALKVSKYNC